MKPRYAALGFVAALYQIAGALIFISSTMLVLLSALSSASQYGSLYSQNYTLNCITLIIGVISGIGVYAFGDLINVFRDMELNSRIAAHHAEEQAEYARRTANALERLVGRPRQAAGRSAQSAQTNISVPPPNPQSGQTD